SQQQLPISLPIQVGLYVDCAMPYFDESDGSSTTLPATEMNTTHFHGIHVNNTVDLHALEVPENECSTLSEDDEEQATKLGIHNPLPDADGCTKPTLSPLMMLRMLHITVENTLETADEREILPQYGRRSNDLRVAVKLWKTY
ncbi:hypothetical protein BGW38_006414, partial [Lunasporangiospora selenospora]